MFSLVLLMGNGMELDKNANEHPQDKLEIKLN